MHRLICVLLVLLAVLASPAVSEEPLLVVLAETGRERDDLPVYAADPGAATVTEALSPGVSGRLLRLFRCVQRFLDHHGGPDPEPAYLLLSGNQGGFPRFGFFLGEEEKRHAGYVDLHRDLDVAGRFGALDQIFPHELAHVIVFQLAGEPPEGGSNQVHAIGVTTDPVTAFQEGFAEHFQILAVDDPDADPATRALATDSRQQEWAARRLQRYGRELAARWSPAGRHRMTFPLWFSRAEQTLRYHAVKANAFAYEPDVPERLLASTDPYDAYLLENLLPGHSRATPKTASRMMACEGVVSALFHRWATDRNLQASKRDEAFYARFGVTRDEVDPIDNVYLKLFFVLHAHGPRDTAELIAGYRATFPDEAAWVDSLVAATLLGQSLPQAPQLWLANADFRIGTSVFDQFRRAPRVHTFDLNAASRVDLLGIPGVDRRLAEAIIHEAPYRRLDELQRVPGVGPSLLARFRDMASEMERRRTRAAQVEAEVMSLVRKILLSYVWRALGLLALAGCCAALLFRFVNRSGWLRAALSGLAASFSGLLAVWLVDAPGGSMAIALPVLAIGLPAALGKLLRKRSRTSALRVLLSWGAASLPAALLAQPLF